jgi:hypothetical protein
VKKTDLFLPVLVVALFVILVVGYVDQSAQTQQREATVALVEEAAILIEDVGEAAFPQFRQEGSRWFQGDMYVFVWRTDGLRVVYPPDTSGEGKNMSTLMDINGKAIGMLFITVALSEEGEGWVDYEWPKPGETEPSSTQTFIKGVTVDGCMYLVGSGYYVEANEGMLRLLQYVSIVIEGAIVAAGLMIAASRKKSFGYGISLTFGIYVFYDLARLIPLSIPNTVLYPVFLVATLSILWTVLMIYRETRKSK